MTIYPSIDLKDGRCVRLLRGSFDTVHTVADDARAVARDFAAAGAEIIHIVDLDGARDGVRRNRELVAAIVAAAPCQTELGGGLRTMQDLAEADATGVWRFIIGSAAASDPGFVSAAVERYGNRVAVGIDAENGVVKTHGWTRSSGITELEMARQMVGLGVTTLVFTDISVDGTQSGPSLERLKALRETVPHIRLVASGGVTTLADVRALTDLGLHAAIVGKALYTGALDLTEALAEARFGHLFEKSELIPAVIQHADSGRVLMLGYMNRASLALTHRLRRAVFWSRSRQALWIKGETSGHYLEVRRIQADCDRDALLLQCRPAGPTCHTGADSCFFEEVARFEG